MAKFNKVIRVSSNVTFNHADVVKEIKSKLESIGGIKQFNEADIEAAACYVESATKEGRPISFSNNFLGSLKDLCRIKVTCEDWDISFRVSYKKPKDDETSKTPLSFKSMAYFFDGTQSQDYRLKIPRKDIPAPMATRKVKYEFETLSHAYDVLKNFADREYEIIADGRKINLHELGVLAGVIPVNAANTNIPEIKKPEVVLDAVKSAF